MLEPILKGLVEWLYEMMIDIMAYASGELLGVMSMDLSYFEKTAPVISEIVNVFIALGWALLIGNMVFQLLKSIMSGVGFEAEDPKIIFLRTFVFSFLLLASRQICDICSGITGTVIEMLKMPTSITVTTPDESMFSLGSGANKTYNNKTNNNQIYNSQSVSQRIPKCSKFGDGQTDDQYSFDEILDKCELDIFDDEERIRTR